MSASLDAEAHAHPLGKQAGPDRSGGSPVTEIDRHRQALLLCTLLAGKTGGFWSKKVTCRMGWVVGENLLMVGSYQACSIPVTRAPMAETALPRAHESWAKRRETYF